METNSLLHSRLAEYIGEFRHHKILVVGDAIADQFVYGAINRVSREAPVFILRHEQTETLPGGAANAAVNIASLGGHCTLLGLIGTDSAGRKLKSKLRAAKVETAFLAESGDWQTTTKVRILAGQTHAPRQQVIRVDYENEAAPPAAAQNRLRENLRQCAANFSAIVISDYNYGVANGLYAEIREIADARQIPVLVDSRFCLTEFNGAASATPNEDEVEQLTGRKFADVADLIAECEKLREKLDLKSLLITRGANGMLLIEKDKSAILLPAVGSLEPVDVTGAGDTVMAAYALSAAVGADFVEAAALANLAGGLVVMKRGTAVVTADELLDALAATE